MKFLTFDETKDFPYYNHNPRISKIGWIILFLAMIIAFVGYGIICLISEFVGSVFFCFSMLIPLLYFSNWDWRLIFQKPTKNEIILAILLFIAYLVYATIVGDILDVMGLAGSSDALLPYVNIEMVVSLVFSIMAEELIKFIPLMFFMRLFFKFSNNRNLSITLSSIIILIYFGLFHYTPEGTIVSVLLIQGLGSIFEIYGYIKTKNVIVPYISHLLTDALIMILMLIGIV